MRLKVFLSTFPFLLLAFLVSSQAVAMGSNTGMEQGAFALDVSNNLINLHAEQSSSKKILKDLENKTGIKVNVFDGVEDKNVTLELDRLPVYAIHTLLEKMEIENFAVVYDQKLASKVIYILPVGEDINKVVANNSDIEILPKVIDVKVAQLVAEDYLPKYYPGDWVFFSSFTLYDLDGIPAAYAYIFRNPKSTISSKEKLDSILESVQLNLNQIHQEISQIQRKDTLSENDNKKITQLKETSNNFTRALYQTQNFATVITGATELSKPLIRCYKALPRFVVKKDVIEKIMKAEYPNKEMRLGRIIYFNPVDIQYELIDKKNHVYAFQAEKTYQSLPDDSYLVSLNDNDQIQLLSVSIKKQVHKERELERERSYDKMSIEDKKLLEESEEKKKKHYKDKWRLYKKK